MRGNPQSSPGGEVGRTRFGEFLEKCRTQIHLYARKLRRTHPEASGITEDLIDEGAEAFLAKPRRVQNEEHLRGLFLNIVRDRFRMRQRRRHTLKRGAAVEALRVSVVDPADESPHVDPAKHVEQHETSQRLTRALERLAPEDRRIIVWRVYDNLPWREIAERLSIGATSGPPEDVARMRYVRAADRLRKVLQ